MKNFLALLALSMMLGVPALAGDAKVKVAIAVDGDTRPATVFPADTPQLSAFILTEGTEKGDKARGVWIAEDTNGTAPANYKIDEGTMTGDKDDFGGAFSLSKPNSGWPVGKYRVDVYIGDDLSGSTKFQIK
jgi:hypothetical protein